MNSPKPLHIFKPGRRTAMSGTTLDFSEADLAASAAAYDPAVHEAPLVVGHPKDNAPAYGWVKSLRCSADGLHAEPQQVDADFAELVNAGRFKKISASFYLPDAPNNPKPGVFYLRHVGFLGAQAPAVKGLRQVEFADAEAGVVEFSDWGMDTNATLWRRLREWFIGKHGQETADTIVRDWEIESMREAARQDDDAPPAAAFAEPATSSQPPKEGNAVTPEQKAALEAENKQLKQRLADAEARDKQRAADVRHADHVAYAEGLVGQAKLAPKHKGAVIAFLDFADNGGETVLEFGEGADKKPLGAAFKAFLDEQPTVVDFSEAATKGRVGDGAGAAGGGSTADFSERDSDPERLAVHRRAQELMVSKGLSYTEAVRQAMRG